MSFANIGPFQLLIVLLIVALIFGTKKLRSLGGDVGGAVKGFRKAMSDEEKEPPGLPQSDAEETSAAKSADAQKTS